MVIPVFFLSENFKQFTVQCMENAGSFSLPYVTAAYHSCMDQDRLTDLDSRCQACLNNHVANRASIRQGNSLIVTAAKIFPDEQIRRIETLLEQDVLHGHYTVMFGFLSAVLQLDLHEAHQMFVFGVLRTIIASAVRLGNVGTIEVTTFLVSCSLANLLVVKCFVTFSLILDHLCTKFIFATLHK
ncbi:Hypp5962 [Branchiostoma lanceolatum]|uniref:Hypp5962 protein n=1 Tax=Branchiostoma lanceolatum TaxID=7740 RepID=A0A8J9YS62_BRALA|nr:Hypp5962 [Branchiostoma lanceolatum]